MYEDSGHKRLLAGATERQSVNNNSLAGYVIQWKMVGAKGFEPSTPRSRTVCATRLRYAPNIE